MDREIKILSVWNVYSSCFFFFQTKCEICYWTQGSTLVQGTTNGDIFDPTDIRNELLLSDHVFKLICIKLEASLLWDVDLLAAREPGSLLRASITCSLFCSLVWMDMTAWPMWTLVSLCPGASQRHHIYLFGAYQPQHRTTSSGLGWHRKGGVSLQDESRPFHNTLSCLGTNTGSLQDLRELSSDTIWPQSENSSTFAFFCPKSKMQILASRTPPQKWNPGYGLLFCFGVVCALEFYCTGMPWYICGS